MPSATDISRYEEIRTDVLEFHKKNPRVWRLFVKFTNELLARGFANYSVKAVFERIRWESDMNSSDKFKLNNNYTAFYARAFMKKFPQHSGFFRTRKQISKHGSINHNPTL